jgi:hypothetical protein
MRPAAFILAVILLACAVDPADEELGQRVLAKLRAGDSTVMADLEPNPQILAAGWTNIRTLRARFQDTTFSPQLIEFEKVASASERTRRLTFLVGMDPDSAVIELWLSTHDGNTLVNTIKARSFER